MKSQNKYLELFAQSQSLLASSRSGEKSFSKGEIIDRLKILIKGIYESQDKELINLVEYHKMDLPFILFYYRIRLFFTPMFPVIIPVIIILSFIIFFLDNVSLHLIKSILEASGLIKYIEETTVYFVLFLSIISIYLLLKVASRESVDDKIKRFSQEVNKILEERKSIYEQLKQK